MVRLKGGDPFVFGRGGEELEYLRRAGVPVVVVPGITAALGCAAESGLPLTFRNEASIAFITAQRADEAAAVDWSSLSDPQTTVVVYMGLASAAAVRDGLIAAGRDGATPAAVLARARGRCAGRRRAPRSARLARSRRRRGPGRSRHRRSRRALDAVARRRARRRDRAGGRMTSPLQQKLKVTGPVVVTANRLADGAVIYRTAQGDWTNDLATAAVVTTAPAASELLTAALADRLAAVDAYVAPVALTAEQRVIPAICASASAATDRPSRCRAQAAEGAMYLYDDFDRTLVEERVREFRDQVGRRLSGELTEEEFKPLRLMNGVYLQLHAYMLRIAIPTARSPPIRCACRAWRANTTATTAISPTRQNIQFNWIKLEQLPDAMADLASAGCTGCRPAAIACATSPPINGPGSRPTRSRMRASGRSCCASISLCIRNSPSSRASSRSR